MKVLAVGDIVGSAGINELKLTTPKFMKDFYEITSDKELEDLKKCLLKELQEEEKYD